MSNRIRRLPDAEQEVMQAIWACQSPVARTDIENILFKEHPMAMTTLLTLLSTGNERLQLLREAQCGLIPYCAFSIYAHIILFLFCCGQ